MNRVQQRKFEQLAKTKEGAMFIETTAERAFDAYLVHATYNKPRFIPKTIWIEIVCWVFKRSRPEIEETEDQK